MTHLDNPIRGNGEGADVSADVKQRARKTVCHFATDKEDAARLLAILGLDGKQDEPPDLRCAGCGIDLTAAQTDTSGAWCTWCKTLVDAGPARAHIAGLRAAKHSLQRISAVSGVPLATVRSIVYGVDGLRAARTTRAMAERVLAVSREELR